MAIIPMDVVRTQWQCSESVVKSWSSVKTVLHVGLCYTITLSHKFLLRLYCILTPPHPFYVYFEHDQNFDHVLHVHQDFTTYLSANHKFLLSPPFLM